MVADAESMVVCLVCFFPADQRLDLNKLGPNDNDTVRGQIVGKEHKHTQFQFHTVSHNRKRCHCYGQGKSSQRYTCV